MSLGKCYRCKTVVEPYLSPQWFVKIRPLAEPAIKAVETAQIRLVPEQWTNNYLAWMRDIRDWCISRQIWWGHQIPAWYCMNCGRDTGTLLEASRSVTLTADAKPLVARHAPSHCPDCGHHQLVRDPDVLDTWFSSGLWPFSTLGWPDDTPELKKFYPTSVLVTGFDILFFWVARMAMLGLRFMNDVPFRDVYIHALVRDAEGQKMSKSKGNVIDPLVMMDKYGTDAFRFTLVALAAQGRDVRLAEERIEGYRNFANKLWNAARLVLSNLDGYDARQAAKTPAGLADRWILSRFGATAADVRTSLRRYRFNDAASAVYQFLWHEFCDWYLEIAKVALYRREDAPARLRTQQTLVTVLEATLRLLHPFMPFITEELWQRLPRGARAPESIMIAAYPKASRRQNDPAAERDMTAVMDIVTAIRNIRGEMRIAPGVTLAVTVKSGGEHTAALHETTRLVEFLGRCRLSVDPGASRPPASALAVIGSSEVYVELAGVVDLAAERARLEKELKRVADTIAFLEAKLARPEFVERAPADIVEKERDRLAEQHQLQQKLEGSLAWLTEASR